MAFDVNFFVRLRKVLSGCLIPNVNKEILKKHLEFILTNFNSSNIGEPTGNGVGNLWHANRIIKLCLTRLLNFPRKYQLI